ncbi:protein S100-A1 isoform X1 [Chamaea fasciata]
MRSMAASSSVSSGCSGGSAAAMAPDTRPGPLAALGGSWLPREVSAGTFGDVSGASGRFYSRAAGGDSAAFVPPEPVLGFPGRPDGRADTARAPQSLRPCVRPSVRPSSAPSPPGHRTKAGPNPPVGDKEGTAGRESPPGGGWSITETFPETFPEPSREMMGPGDKIGPAPAPGTGATGLAGPKWSRGVAVAGTCSKVSPVILFDGFTSAAMGSQLEGAMETLINVFHHYSGKEGDKYKLSKKELKELLQSELGCFLETQKDAGAVEKIMQDLDENGDGEVDFQEFVVLVAALTVACNTFFWENA